MYSVKKTAVERFVYYSAYSFVLFYFVLLSLNSSGLKMKSVATLVSHLLHVSKTGLATLLLKVKKSQYLAK